MPRTLTLCSDDPSPPSGRVYIVCHGRNGDIAEPKDPSWSWGAYFPAIEEEGSGWISMQSPLDGDNEDVTTWVSGAENRDPDSWARILYYLEHNFTAIREVVFVGFSSGGAFVSRVLSKMLAGDLEPLPVPVAGLATLCIAPEPRRYRGLPTTSFPIFVGIGKRDTTINPATTRANANELINLGWRVSINEIWRFHVPRKEFVAPMLGFFGPRVSNRIPAIG